MPCHRGAKAPKYSCNWASRVALHSWSKVGLNWFNFRVSPLFVLPPPIVDLKPTGLSHINMSPFKTQHVLKLTIEESWWVLARKKVRLHKECG